MFCLSFTTTYSSNVNESCVLWTGTIVAPSGGYSLTITGGIVSLGPPLGGVVVFAQECENITDASTAPTGTAGKYLESIFLIMPIDYMSLLTTL